MSVFVHIKSVCVRCLPYHKRRKSKSIFLVICLTLVFMATLMVASQAIPYQFHYCRVASLSDAVIGYETSYKSVSIEGFNRTQLRDQCRPASLWYTRLPLPDGNSNLKDWSFSKSVECPRFCLQTKRLQRRMMVMFSCNETTPRIFSRQTSSAGEIYSVAYGDSCLADVIDHCSKGDKPVPNVVHYIWYGKKRFDFVHFLSFISVVRFMKPCLILIHGQYIPYGNYWNFLLQISPNLVHVRRDLIRTLYGNTLSYKEHGADVMRIEALQKYGGLYLDFDSVILRSVDALRVHNVTMGRENSNNLGNQFIMAAKGARFLQLWHEGYRHYRTNNWGWNSLYVPYNIALANQNLVHIEGNKFTRPHFHNRHVIYKENYDWTENYAMHLYMRDYGGKLDMEIIRRLNTTIGAVSRHILFGDKELCNR